MYYKLFINDAILQMFTAPVQKWTRNFSVWMKSLFARADDLTNYLSRILLKKKKQIPKQKNKKNQKKTKKTKQNKTKQNKKKKKTKNKAKKESKEILYLQVFPSSPLTRVFVPKMFNQEN